MKVDYGFKSAINEWLNEKRKENRVNDKNPFPELECPLCQRRTDVLFPSGKLKLCPKCAQRVLEQNEVPAVGRRIMILEGEVCYYCGQKFIVGYEVETYMCRECTRKIAENERKIQEWHSYLDSIGARRF